MKQYKHTVYDLGNQILYDLCANHFRHTKTDEILAKTVLIGRTYAASLDRGKDRSVKAGGRTLINDDFYQKKIVPLFMYSDIDRRMRLLKKLTDPSDHIREILSLHYHLAKRLGRINKQVKRSFCSKYLHFHLPHLFFLFDSRAQSAINSQIRKKDVKGCKKYKTADEVYQLYFYQCLALQNKLVEESGGTVSPRQLDNYLLEIANKKLRLKERAARKQKNN